MPVAPTTGRPPRQIVMLAVATAIGVLSMVWLFTTVSDQSQSGDLRLDLGDTVFSPGDVETLEVTVAEDGPILFSDVAGRDRDIYLQHIGNDVETGWLAFAARPLSAPRACLAQWQMAQREFIDTCDGTVYNQAGDGLPMFPVSVDADGNLSIDLNAADRDAGG